MKLAIIALAAAHWVAWPGLAQKGVSIGHGADEHLILFLPDGDCRRMIVHTSPHMQTFYSDRDKARAFLWRSKLCLKGR